jgi:O-antigen/teichoic acid export membrane protein
MAAFALFVIAATILSSAGKPGLAAAIAGVSLVVVVVADRAALVRAGVGDGALAALAAGTATGTVVALVAAAVAVYVRFRTFVGWLTTLRALAAAGVAFAVASVVPHATKVGSLLALVIGFFAFLAIAIALGEIGKEELEKARSMLRR